MTMTPKFREEFAGAIKMFIKDKVRDAGAKGVVVGLSGGLDSAVVAAISAQALGPDRVLCLLLPEANTPPKEMEDAKELAEGLGTEHMLVHIDPVLEACKQQMGGDVEPVAFANVKARSRMVLLYYHANLRGYLVMGTSNKSELFMGYFTKHGDGGVDYMPLGDLYKTQVRGLAEHLGVPRKFIDKAPSANLLPDQTDEEDMGISYEDLDRILLGIELGMHDHEIAERTGLSEAEATRIRGVVHRTRHKRRAPLVPKLGIRTVGLDWRE
jgi:NAD+ synthase